MIGGVQVPGFRYVVYGTKRGQVSTHRTKRAAFRSLAEDARKCMKEEKPSDAQVYRWREKWELVISDS
jgi:DNA-binding transcriptional regulator PaaX